MSMSLVFPRGSFLLFFVLIIVTFDLLGTVNGVIYKDLCSEQPKLTQCQALLNFDKLPTNYNCNPYQDQNKCKLNDLVDDKIASCRLDVRRGEEDFYQRYDKVF